MTLKDMTIKVKTFPAATGLITTAKAKVQLGIPSGYTGLDSKVNDMIYAATDYIRRETGRYSIEQSLECFADDWDLIEGELPYGWFQEVVSLKYIDEDGASQTVDTADYYVEGVGTDEGRITFLSTFTFPNLYEYSVLPITLEIVIGYEKVTTDYQVNIPEGLQTACKLKVEEISDGVDNSDIIENAMYDYRSWRMG